MKAEDFLSAEDFLNEDAPKEISKFNKVNKKLLGYGEAALSMVAPLPSMIAGGLYGLGGLLSGKGVDESANDVAKVQDWNFGFGAYKPTTEEGTKSAESLANMFAYPGEKAGDVGGWVGKKLGNEELGRLTAKLPVDVAMNFLPLHAMVKAPIKAAEAVGKMKKPPAPISDVGAKMEATKTAPTAEAFLSEGEGAFDNIRKSQGAPKVLPEVVPEEPSAMPQMAAFLEQQKAREAQAAIEARQQAMEQDVARQTSLDQNAAERARQDQAPTGFEQWKEQQRQAAETRIPGDNTPMNMESPYPVDVNQFPQVLKDAPFKHENGIDFTPQITEDLARPLEQKMQRSVEEDAAWKTRQKEQAQEQVLQEQRQATLEDPSLIGMEDKLRTEAYKPEGDGQGPKTRNFNRFGQGGAIDSKLLDDAYKAIKSIGGGFKLILKGGSFPEVKVQAPNGNIVGTANFEPFSGKLRDTNTDLVSEGTYVDKNYQRRGLAAEMYQFLAENGADIRPSPDQSSQGAAMWHGFEQYGLSQNKKIYASKQRGAIDPDLLSLGIPKLISGIKGLVKKPPEADTLNTPRSEANIAAKEALRKKANAVGVDSYQQITTKEEALANLGKDISGITQEAGAGVGGAVRRNPTNGPLKYTRYLLDTANNGMNSFLKTYVTGRGGFNDTYGKLSTKEKQDVYALKKWLSENQVDYTDVVAEQAGLSPAAKAHMEARTKAITEIETQWNQMNLEKGLDPIEHRAGYMASIFDKNFQALVGKMVDGRFKMDGFIGAVSRAEFNQALKMYENSHIIKLGDNGRTGLRTQGAGKFAVRDDLAFLLNAMAEHDPKYAEVKQQLATANSISNKGYMNYDVHEMKKRGITGHLGNKPWLPEAENMKQALEAEIRYFDQASKYVHGQKLLDGVREIVPEIVDKQPNTVRYLNKYLNHLTGKSIEPSAAFVNQLVDVGTKAAGYAAAKAGIKMPENPSGMLRSIGTGMNALMMNIYSPAMFTAQTMQLYVSGIPEAVKVQQNFGLKPTQFADSMAKSHLWRTLLALDNYTGVLGDKVKAPEHMKEAYAWMKEHGMDDFNEVMLSQDILESKTTKNAKTAAFWPTTVPERFTRPTMFMWMVDMFHEAGFETKEAIARAKNATDYSMTDYRPEEAPLVYDRMGVLNPETSALQKYKHNALDQWTSRIKESPQNKAALLSMLGLSIAFGGLLGMPAMQEIDQLLVRPVTGKSAREHLENALGEDTKLADGLASAYTSTDLASRFSTADVAPNSFGEAVAGARLSKLYKMLAASFEYGANMDKASALALGKELIPSGASQLYNEAFMSTDNKIVNKRGQITSGVDRGPFPSKYAITGMRPIAEKRDSELNYARNARVQDVKKAQDKAKQRMEMALLFRDQGGLDDAIKDFEENEGDMNSIKTILSNAEKQGMMTEKERMQGTPKKTPMSIRRFLELEGK